MILGTDYAIFLGYRIRYGMLYKSSQHTLSGFAHIFGMFFSSQKRKQIVVTTYVARVSHQTHTRDAREEKKLMWYICRQCASDTRACLVFSCAKYIAVLQFCKNQSLCRQLLLYVLLFFDALPTTPPRNADVNVCTDSSQGSCVHFVKEPNFASASQKKCYMVVARIESAS